MKFNIDNYKGKYVMHCKTEEEARDFCKYLHCIGKSWFYGDSYLEHTYWNTYQEDTCYNFNEGLWESIVYYKHYTILEWSDFMDNEFTKDMLKDGMVVELRKGDRCVIIGNKCIDKDGYLNLDDVNSDLTNKYFTRLDIVKVYSVKSVDTIFEIFNPVNLELIWERKEKEVVKLTVKEICEKLGYDVEIVKE